MDKKFYQCSVSESLEQLACHEQGLDSQTAQERLENYGFNEIEAKKTSPWLRFIRQFNNPLVYILLISATTTAVLTLNGKDMLADTIVILSVVVLNAILGFFQEGKAENALSALQDMLVSETIVIRDGKEQTIPTRTLVPGDIVVLEGGDKVPADLRLLDSRDLHVDEAALTGESLPVKKQTEALDNPDLPPGDQSCMAFSGTFLVSGFTKGLVTSTGLNTEFGKIAAMMSQTEQVATPLQKKISEFTRTLIMLILVVGLLNFILGLFIGYPAAYIFLASVSLIVAAIPEMLPMIVTAILALSASIMAKRNALIRRLPAAETLGCTSVICSDKTGTLTRNEMTVVQLYSAGENYQLSGSGYEPKGQFKQAGEVINEIPSVLTDTLRTGMYCNNAALSDKNGHHGIIGDPTEGALLVSAAKADIDKPSAPALDEIPFDSGRMYMATLYEGENENHLYIKGSPEVIMGLCENYKHKQGLAPLSEAEQKTILAQVEHMAKDALRVLAMAEKTVPKTCTELSDEDLLGACFLGLQGMMDPPRDEVMGAVAKCKTAGIRTVMITGDHRLTAHAIAEQLGIVEGDNQRIIIGEELAQMDDDDLFAVVEDVSVYARVAPEHKLRVVQQLQRHGHVTAITGDGVNDAPALKAADIGIAMGSGTEVSKEASSMVLTDDNFSSIVGAVEEGRHAWHNLAKAILYTLPTNGGQALLVMGALLLSPFIPLFGARLPLEPVQILWINLFDSVFLTMPLMMEKKSPNLLKHPPRNANAKIADALFFQRVLLIGLAIALPTFFVYHHFGAAAVVDGVVVNPLLLTQAQTAAFWAVLLVHFGFVMSARSTRRSAFSFSPFSNRWLLAGIIISILARFLPTFIPEFASLFRTAEFPLEWWLVILPCLLPGFIVLEIDKYLRYGRGR